MGNSLYYKKRRIVLYFSIFLEVLFIYLSMNHLLRVVKYEKSVFKLPSEKSIQEISPFNHLILDCDCIESTMKCVINNKSYLIVFMVDSDNENVNIAVPVLLAGCSEDEILDNLSGYVVSDENIEELSRMIESRTNKNYDVLPYVVLSRELSIGSDIVVVQSVNLFLFLCLLLIVFK